MWFAQKLRCAVEERNPTTWYVKIPANELAANGSCHFCE
jgi:hypothetical protein